MSTERRPPFQQTLPCWQNDCGSTGECGAVCLGGRVQLCEETHSPLSRKYAGLRKDVASHLHCREEGADILILARTDARQAVDLEEALDRAAAFAEAGADALFIDALASEEELRAFAGLPGVAAAVPKVALHEAVAHAYYQGE